MTFEVEVELVVATLNNEPSPQDYILALLANPTVVSSLLVYEY